MLKTGKPTKYAKCNTVLFLVTRLLDPLTDNYSTKETKSIFFLIKYKYSVPKRFRETEFQIPVSILKFYPP